ncbi:MAG: class I SAM-dependent methyltransferase [Rhodocyclaceae bacterium]|nr:class I SAM-dependent methyltransferase [Rhodocyclaceae bacterium]
MTAATPMASSEISDYYAAERPELLAFLRPLGPFASALDIGCAAGMLGAGLQREGIVGACDGIELNFEAARLAETRPGCGGVPAPSEVGGEVPQEHYDLLILADVLEHLSDPWAALRQLRAHRARLQAAAFGAQCAPLQGVAAAAVPRRIPLRRPTASWIAPTCTSSPRQPRGDRARLRLDTALWTAT